MRFCRENREKSLLECRRLSSKSWNEKPLIRGSIGLFQVLSHVRIHFFPPNLSSYNIRFQFQIVYYRLQVNLRLYFGFLSLCVRIFYIILLVDFSTNLDPNRVIFLFCGFAFELSF